MIVRKARPADRNEWARMRNALWPGSVKKHLQDIDWYFSQDKTGIVDVFMVERSSGKPGGFIELNVRNYAEGSEAASVPFIEGWYIDADIRGKGYGKQLIKAAEKWAAENGFTELATDAELKNTGSIAAHRALGFKEVERLVCFIKKLK